MEFLNALWRVISRDKGSLIAAIVFFVLGWLSMGLVGAAIYESARPVLWLLFGKKAFLDALSKHGISTWPTVLLVGFFWPLGFLMAGWMRHQPFAQARPGWLVALLYVAILWLWGVCCSILVYLAAIK